MYDCTASLDTAFFILGYLSCATSVLHMVAISLDRFVAVALPLRHKNFMEKCGLKVMLIVSWSIPIIKGDYSSRFIACHSVGFIFGKPISLIWNLCLQLFLNFLFLLSDRGISATLQ